MLRDVILIGVLPQQGTNGAEILTHKADLEYKTLPSVRLEHIVVLVVIFSNVYPPVTGVRSRVLVCSRLIGGFQF